MKIAVTGPNGRLGSELTRRGCIPIGANCTDFFTLREDINKIGPDVVIHCAAATNVDRCEVSPKWAMDTNFIGTSTLLNAFSGKVVYMSTDYIFDGESGPYYESDRPNPISVYGISKLAGEVLARRRKNSLVVRTTILFNACSGNFVTSVYGSLKRGERLGLPTALQGNPTFVPHLARGIMEAVEKDLSGTLNIVGNRVLSRFRLGQMIAEMAGLDVGLIEEGPVRGGAPRPLSAGLRLNLAYKLGLSLGDPVEGIKAVINELERVEPGRSGNN